MELESQLLPARVLIKRLGNVALAHNRRVHLTLSSTGQQSARTYPFNANDFARLADRNVPKRPVAKVELAAQKERIGNSPVEGPGWTAHKSSSAVL